MKQLRASFLAVTFLLICGSAIGQIDEDYNLADDLNQQTGIRKKFAEIHRIKKSPIQDDDLNSGQATRQAQEKTGDDVTRPARQAQDNATDQLMRSTRQTHENSSDELIRTRRQETNPVEDMLHLTRQDQGNDTAAMRSARQAEENSSLKRLARQEENSTDELARLPRQTQENATDIMMRSPRQTSDNLTHHLVDPDLFTLRDEGSAPMKIARIKRNSTDGHKHRMVRQFDEEDDVDGQTRFNRQADDDQALQDHGSHQGGHHRQVRQDDGDLVIREEGAIKGLNIARLHQFDDVVFNMTR